MKDVIVYRCGKVVADGVELSHVRFVDPPTHQPKGDEQLGSISLDITGTLTYSPLTYANAPAAVPVPPEPEHPDTTRVRKAKERIADLRNSGALRSDTYAELLNALA